MIIITKKTAYYNLLELLADKSPEEIVRYLCNFYSTDELIKLSEHLSDEVS